MKKAIRSSLITALMPLTVVIGEFRLTQVVTATPAESPISRCTRQTCTPYRANYERAIARGIISRPSLVSDQYQAIRLADKAIERGNLNEAACRYAQALVIISESEGNDKALAFERSLDAEFQEGRGITLRRFLPAFARVFPLNTDPYR